MSGGASASNRRAAQGDLVGWQATPGQLQLATDAACGRTLFHDTVVTRAAAAPRELRTLTIAVAHAGLVASAYFYSEVVARVGNPQVATDLVILETDDAAALVQVPRSRPPCATRGWG
jgi:hypothetical protein